MYKLLALYDHPDDVEAFERYYRDVHTPLAQTIPGLQRLVIDRAKGDPMGGKPRYHLVAELHFADKAAFDKAAATQEFRATGADLANFAKGKVTLMIVEAQAA